MKFKISSAFVFSYFFIPGLALTLYFLCYSLITDLLNIEGVNTVFSDRSWKILLPVIIILGFAYFFLRFRKSESFFEKNEKTSLSLPDFVLILIPLTPIVQYIIINNGILSLIDVLIILGCFSFSSFLFIFLCQN